MAGYSEGASPLSYMLRTAIAVMTLSWTTVLFVIMNIAFKLPQWSFIQIPLTAFFKIIKGKYEINIMR